MPKDLESLCARGNLSQAQSCGQEKEWVPTAALVESE